MQQKQSKVQGDITERDTWKEHHGQDDMDAFRHGPIPAIGLWVRVYVSEMGGARICRLEKSANKASVNLKESRPA